jgi:demethylmenaquinone methyltransferase/2-methoxy-6-polyprenyl-1,4-benzoquinol methylase
MSANPRPAESQDPIPPHAPLTGYYGSDAERRRYVDELFDKTARHYNTIERIFGNGGLLYRRFSLWRAGMKPGMKVLDVAIGTAAVAQGAAKLVSPGGKVFGVDPNKCMLGEARKVFKGPLTRGVAEALPFRSNQFDFVTMGIALRHVPDLVTAFRQYYRVLKPGGKVWILEGHVPKSKIGHALTRFAWKTVIPGLTLIATRDKDAKLLMDYYWDTVEQCVPPEAILASMRIAGFTDARFKGVVPGAICEYSGTKPL